MDKVIFDGVEYTKASVAAKELRYTSDYLGQLCRAKKIDARLVGRTWFVNLDSVHSHKKSKYQSVKTVSEQDDKNPELAIKIESSRNSFEPVEQRRVVRPVISQGNIIKHSETRSIKVAYEIDDGYLIPKITKVKAKAPRSIFVEPADAKRIKISKSREYDTDFQASELPEISLSGELNVTTYKDKEEEVPEVENEPKNKLISDKPENVLTKVVEKTEQKLPHLPHLNPPQKFSEIKPVVGHNVVPDVSRASHVQSQEVQSNSENLSNDTKDKSVSLEKIDFSPSNLNPVPDIPPSRALVYLPAIATFLAIVCVGLIFSASSSVYVSSTVYDSQVVLQLANLLEIFNR